MASARNFVGHIKQLTAENNFDFIINADQSGFEKMILARKTLAEQGIKKI
jgi:hypothetical protein